MLKNWLVGGILLSLSWLLCATENDVEYRTTLIAATQQDTERQQLFREGLVNLLEKLTFQTNLENHPEVKQAREHVMSFVDQYTYEGNQLSIQYSPALVKDLVNRLGKGTSQQPRSKVMLWVVVDDKESKRLVGEDTDPEFLATMKKVANQKGYTLTLPILDLEDVSLVSTEDVWAFNSSALQSASKRYGAQTLLVARLHHQNATAGEEVWQGDWMFLNSTQSKQISVQQGSLESVLKEGFTQTLAQLVEPYSPNTQKQITPAVSASTKSCVLLINNVQTGQDFSRVETALRNLSPVSRVAVAEILGSSAIFEITLKPEQDTNTLIQAVNLSQNLVEEQIENTSHKVDLAFRFNR